MKNRIKSLTVLSVLAFADEITFTAPRVVQIPGMEKDNDTVKLAEAVDKCQLITFDADGAVVNPAAGVRPAGVALLSGVEGEYISYGTSCELAGFEGGAPGDLVYPSTDVAGGMATGADGTDTAGPIGRITPDGERIKFFTV